MIRLNEWRQQYSKMHKQRPQLVGDQPVKRDKPKVGVNYRLRIWNLEAHMSLLTYAISLSSCTTCSKTRRHI